MNRQRTFLLFLMLCSLLLSRLSAQAQTGFPYNGTLPNKPTGSYDLQFRLYTASSGGAQVGSTLSLSSVSVASGSYSVSLDFGSSSFGGSPLYLAISYRVHGATSYTNLSPRVLQSVRFASVSNSAQGLQGLPVSAAVPASGQGLQWNGSAWAPANQSVITYSAGAGLALTGNVFSIASGGVIASMLANGSVTSSAISNGAVTTSAISNGAVTASKLSWPLSESLSSGSALLSLTNTNTGSGIGGYFSGFDYGVEGISSNGYGVYGYSSSIYGVYGYSDSGVGGYFSGGSSGYGVFGVSSSGTGVYGYSSGSKAAGYFTNTGSGYGVYGTSAGTNTAGYFINTTGSGDGVDGFSNSGNGGYFTSSSGPGVYGNNVNSGNWGVVGGATYGVTGQGHNNAGVYAYSDTNNGIFAQSGSGYAGYFAGDLQVTGAIYAGTKDFKIDHPLDPANKYLLHACVESDQMKTFYDGHVTTDANGNATVTLPDWFEALNKDFEYHLTVIGQFAQAIISHEIQNYSFSIQTDKPYVKVSWQVTGVRQDAYAKAHPLQVEQEKPEKEKGKYLHPVEEGFDETLGIDYEMIHQHK